MQMRSCNYSGLTMGAGELFDAHWLSLDVMNRTVGLALMLERQGGNPVSSWHRRRSLRPPLRRIHLLFLSCYRQHHAVKIHRHKPTAYRRCCFVPCRHSP